MKYETFRREVERVLDRRKKLMTWEEIKSCSEKLRQKAPYHVYVRKLQADIGLVRLKSGGKNLWGLRKWFESGEFREYLPDSMRLTVLFCENEQEYAIAVGDTLRRIYPVGGVKIWDVIEVRIKDFLPKEDKRPESMVVENFEHVGTVDDGKARMRIINNVSESGEFIHRIYEGKTLGLIKPRFRCFYFYDEMCEFHCDQSICTGHKMRVLSRDTITGEKVYFLLELFEDWQIRSVISLSDPQQMSLSQF